MTLRDSFEKILSIVEANPELNDIFTDIISSNEKGIQKQIDRFRAYDRLSGKAKRADSTDCNETEAKEHYKREMTRLIEQFLEREYYYSFRKINHRHEYEGEVYYSHEDALETTNRTWDGEGDILGMMELKLTHMIHNLRENAAQKDIYIDAYHFTEKNVSEQDKAWAIEKALDDHFGKGAKNHFNMYGYTNSDDDYVYRLFLGNVNVPVEESDSGLRHYYLSKYNTPDCKCICVETSVDSKIDPKDIPPEKKLYTIDFKKGLDFESEEAPQYRTKNQEYTMLGILETLDLDKVQKIIDDNNVDIHNIKENVISYNQSFDVDWADYKKLSKEMIPNIRGNIITLRQLWQLRHDIVKLRNLEDTDDKYFDMWINAPEDKRSDLIKQSYELFKKDRKELYQKICDQMVEYGRGWWD